MSLDAQDIAAVERLLRPYFYRVERLILMATQAEIDALTTQLTSSAAASAAATATLIADDASISAEIARLKVANPTLDITALSASVQASIDAVTAAQAAVDATTALVPAVTPPAVP